MPRLNLLTASGLAVALAPLCVVLLLFASPAHGDDLRVRQLENEVSRLQRELDAQTRRIDELERSSRTGVGMGTSPGNTPPSTSKASPRADSSPSWLTSSNWNRVQVGMKELDVIATLGRPTSVRTDADGKTRAFLYAMELGPTAILAGRVNLSDTGSVLEVIKPTLR